LDSGQEAGRTRERAAHHNLVADIRAVAERRTLAAEACHIPAVQIRVAAGRNRAVAARRNLVVDTRAVRIPAEAPRARSAAAASASAYPA